MSNSIFAPLRSLVLRLVSSRSPRLTKAKYRRRRTLFAPEFLEQRSLMAGDFAGTVFNDLNANGVNESSDPGLSGWTVFVDSNNDGALTAGEPKTVTDIKGKFSIVGLPVGSVNIYEIVQPGFKPTAGFTDHQLITIREGRVVKSDYPNVSAPVTKGDIAGTAFEDLNLNGIKESGEHGLPGWTMFVDANADGIFNTGEISTTADADGDFVLVGVPAGAAKVFEIPQGGYGPVSSGLFPLDTAVNFRQVTVVAGGSVRAEFPNVITSVGTIQGSVWNDANGDGIHQATEAAMVGRNVFVDLDGNGVQGATEPVRITDAIGSYSFVNIRSGSYTVVDVIPTGFVASENRPNAVPLFVSTGSVQVVDFYNLVTVTGSIRGNVFSDVNSDGILTAPEPGLAGWRVYVDVNKNGSLDSADPQAITDATGNYLISSVPYGTNAIRAVTQPGFTATSPASITSLILNGENRVGVNFGNHEPFDFSISGLVFNDVNKDGVRDPSETGISGVTVFLDSNNNGILDLSEPTSVSSVDLFYTPTINEIGTYSFSHLARGSYHVVEVLPANLTGTVATETAKTVSVGPASIIDVNFADRYRLNEIHGVVFDDTNLNHTYDTTEYARPGVSVFIDLNRDDTYEVDEPRTTTGEDGSYSFVGLTPGAYVVREDHDSPVGPHTYPTTGGGILWPDGISHGAVGNVTPTSITTSLENGQHYLQTVSLTLPGTGTLTNLVDVFLLFDDTGSFTSNSPIVRAAFPTIISSLQASLPGIDLGFGVGRFEEYGNFAAENASGRPFILNQPIVANSTLGSAAAIQAALDRVAPGFGGDAPETDIEALYQLVTGAGFDGNGNGSVLDSGRAGLASTQVAPGASGDVPSFASFSLDPVSGGMAPAGNVGGAGFRTGALPIVLLATDTGFAYQPKGETSIVGAGGLTLPVSALTQTSRATTPFNSGAGIQETVTGLNALGALVIGLGTNPDATIDPRKGLEALSNLTGAINRSTSTIANGTTDTIAPGDPLYFQIGTGFGSTVADGVINAIRNAVTNIAMDITVRSSDPRVQVVNHTGTLLGVRAGQTASFDLEFIGDGKPHRFDLEFVRAGTNVVLGSIPVVFGTPVVGDGYSYDELEDGEIHHSSHFGNYVANVAPSFVAGPNVTVLEDAGTQTVASWATSISAGPTRESRQVLDFIVTNDNAALFSSPPKIAADGSLSFTPALNANGVANVVVQLHDNGGVGTSGSDTSATQTIVITVTAVNDAPIAVGESYSALANSTLSIPASGVLGNDTDAENDAIVSQLISAPAHGSLTLNANGSFLYTPAAGFGGADSFSYVASDGSLSSNIATVSFNVTGVNSAPVAVNDIFTTLEDTTLTQSLPGVLLNDLDAEGDAMTVTVVTPPAHGSLTLNTNGSFSYIPAPNFNGADGFTYVANDGRLASNVASVILDVTPVNDAPLALNDSFTATEDTPLNVVSPGLVSNDTDIEGDPLQALRLVGPTHGTLTLAANGSFLYAPALNFNGVDSFTYKVNDGLLDSNVATVLISIAAVNDAPIATNDNYSTNQNTTINVAARGVLLNDTDVEGDVLSAAVATDPTNGSLVLNADGSFRYTPNLNFTGTDTFTYRASDAVVASGLATVSVVVVPVVQPTKFFVADLDRGATFKYAADGAAISNFALNRSANKPRGIASNSTGTTQWVIDTNGSVTIYDNIGNLAGTWQPQNVGKPEGITVWGNDLWIVDPTQDRVFKFTGGASLRTGRVAATSSFALNSGNLNSTDLVSDGSHLWVVNDVVGVDKVFRYSTAGVLEGSWNISTTNPSPTGITIDPTSVNHIWIVDASTDRVYQYDGGSAILTGNKEPSISFALSATDTNPQGIADPMGQSDSKSGRSDSIEVEHNFLLPHDVDDDGDVTPLDALLVVNQLNRGSESSPSIHRQFHDVNDDSVLSPLDALVLINELNSKAADSAGSTKPTIQASTIRSSTTGVRVRAEMEIEGSKSELKIRVDNAPTSTSLPVVLNDIVLGQLMTDDRGRGQLVLGSGDDNQRHLPLPQGLTSLTPEMELIIGDVVRGTLSQVAKVENEGARPSPSLNLVAAFANDGKVIRSAEYEQEIENGVSKRKFEAKIEKATPNSSYEVSVAGIIVGNIATDSKGKGKLRLVSIPKDASELLMPVAFPSIAVGTRVTIGSESSTLK
jgi:VCBS repeat-containing protein